VAKLARDPMARALRLDKLTLAALDATLRLYLEPERAWAEIPTLRLLARPLPELEAEARTLAARIAATDPTLEVKVDQTESRVGGGALPLLALPSAAVWLRPRPDTSDTGDRVEDLERDLRRGEPAVLGRVEAGWVVLDLRAMLPGDAEVIAGRLGERAQDRRAERR
jgi:L-seryl-tRNA(Ser) seleniumtransferase